MTENIKLQHMAETLGKSGKYRIIEQYQKPECYHLDDTSQKLIGIFLDVETTGLDYTQDKIIELGMVRFEYSEDGRIFRIIDEFSQYQDPGISISPMITELTGISDDMVRGCNINLEEVERYVQSANLIIAHNAKFDRAFVETMLTTFPRKPWACLMEDVNWRSEGIESNKLEYIAYKCGFFYEGHRAATDCLAGIHVLSKPLPKSQRLALTELLVNSQKTMFRICASGAPYAHKDTLKQRGYKWTQFGSNKTQAWCILVDKAQVEAELAYLRSDIYEKQNIKLPIEIIDMHNRFSVATVVSNAEKHKNELEWIQNL